MPTKKTTAGKVVRNAKSGFFIFHGIKIAEAGKPTTKVTKVIEKELRKRSESRGERKSA